jgi:hypothetical protein
MPPAHLQGTYLDLYRQGAAWSAKTTFEAEPETFGIGFALVPLHPDRMGQPTAWIINRFKYISEGFRWLYNIANHGNYVYAAIFTRTVHGPLLEAFGNAETSSYAASIPLLHPEP